MQKITLALTDSVDGMPIDELPFEHLQQQLNRDVPSARWAYLGYLDDCFCMDTVVSEGKLKEIREQARKSDLVAELRSESWPAGQG